MESKASPDSSMLERHMPKPTPLNVVLGLLTFWVVGVTFDQHGFVGLGVAVALLFAAAFASAMLSMLARDANTHQEPFMAVAAVATLFWFYFSGNYLSWATLVWDLAGVALGGLVGSLVFWGTLAVAEHKRAQKTKLFTEHRLLPAWTTLAAWLVITLLTLWRQAPLPRDLTRFERLGPAASIVPEQAQRWEALRVGMALSGGGYRAAVYHAGVLHALEALGIRVNVLSAVSGGSIIGAYYAVGGSPAAFKDAVAEGRFNIKRELMLLHNALRLPFPLTVPVLDARLFKWYEFSRRDVQAGMLRHTLFGDDESWQQPVPGQPRLVINATDLTFGTQVGMMPNGAVLLWPHAQPQAFSGEAWRLSEALTLADRVAISGAFPGAFPAKTIGATAVSRNLPDERLKPFNDRPRPLLLADGGIYDNTGVSMLRAVDHFARNVSQESGIDPQWVSDMMLISDAGAIFGVKPDLGDFGQVVRAADVGSALVERGSANAPEVVFSAQEHFASPQKQFLAHGLAGTVQATLGKARMERYLTTAGFDRKSIYPKPVLAVIAALLPEGTATDDPTAMRRALEESMDLHLKQFQETSTLDDLLPRERVEHLYTLGQLMVYIHWPRIERSMDAALANKAASARGSTHREPMPPK